MAAHFEAADVRRAADGDHEAFERLYREHVGRVYAICVRMVDDQSAEDLTQEIFVKKAFLVTNANVKTICGELYADSDADADDTDDDEDVEQGEGASDRRFEFEYSDGARSSDSEGGEDEEADMVDVKL